MKQRISWKKVEMALDDHIDCTHQEWFKVFILINGYLFFVRPIVFCKRLGPQLKKLWALLVEEF